MFLAIIWALLNLAPRKDNGRVRILTFANVGITATVKTSFIRVTGVPSRVLPLQYGDVVTLMAKLPEMDIVVKDNDVVVGKGTMRSTALSGSVRVPLTADVSVS